MVATVDPTIGIVKEDEIPAVTDWLSRRSRNGAEKRHRFKQRRIHASSHIADHCRFAGRQFEYIHRIDTRVDAADDHRFA